MVKELNDKAKKMLLDLCDKEKKIINDYYIIEDIDYFIEELENIKYEILENKYYSEVDYGK